MHISVKNLRAAVVESVVKSKKYLLPLAILNPQLTAGLAIAYFTDGRFKIPKGAEKVLVPDQSSEKPAESSPAAE